MVHWEVTIISEEFFKSQILTKILPFLTARYTLFCALVECNQSVMTVLFDYSGSLA